MAPLILEVITTKWLCICTAVMSSTMLWWRDCWTNVLLQKSWWRASNQWWEWSKEIRHVAVCACLADCSCMYVFYSQLEMLSAQPPQLLAMLGFPPAVLQNEMQKHREMEKLKVCRHLDCRAVCTLDVGTSESIIRIPTSQSFCVHCLQIQQAVPTTYIYTSIIVTSLHGTMIV